MSDTGSPVLVLSEFLPYQISITSNAISNRIAEVYRSQFGLKVTEWRVMAVLGDTGALTQRELTSLTLMDKVAVNRACKVLEQRGLASRKPNTSDGRSHLLALTDAGVAMHDRIVPLAREVEQRLLAPLSAQERQTLKDLLKRLRDHSHTLGPATVTDGCGAD
ncbi:MarR family transcriptional regulator [Altererythrobacter confluentis]|uniref:MarR family transcriptional regulator n=1 Tax=Allopontixanthobacter confluentis TaxID=1849021 RepID=A0A6L7GBH6_9SPHN|nr:MarR family winged helix-turn-helix transcriptional regulator [Allopontixanthobacter confluentis]MXP13422.1 MarR family transcriptional regulator [Allopontixanthobacter confluentis]